MMQQRKQRAFWKSLRGKILILMLAVSLIPIILVGGLMYNSMAASEDSVNDSINVSRDRLQRDTIGSTKATQAWNLSVEFETWIAERIREVKAWATNAAIIDSARTAEDPGGEARSFMEEKVGASVFFGDVYVISAAGKTVVQYSGDQPVDQKNNIAWKEAWSRGLYVTDPFPAGFIGSYPYYINIGVRIDDLTEDEPLGVLVASVMVHPLNWATDYSAKVPGNRLLILGPDNMIIADSGDPERYLEDDPKWTVLEQEIITQINNQVSDDVTIQPKHRIAGGYVAGYARATNADTNVRFDEYDFKGLGWTVIVEQSADEALAPLDSLEEVKNDLSDATTNGLYTVIGVVIGLGILVTAVALLISRSITNPVATLRDAAEKVSTGDMSVSINISSDDEIGDLAESFARMVTAVRFLSQEEE